MEVPDTIRTFDHFPEQSICPLCGDGHDGPTVLVQITATAKDGICEASPVHLWCLADSNRHLHDKAIGIIYAREVRDVACKTLQA